MKKNSAPEPTDDQLRQTTLLEFIPEDIKRKIIQSKNAVIIDEDDNRCRPVRVPSQWCCCGHLSENHNYFGCVVIENLEQCTCNSFVSDDSEEKEKWE